VFGVGKPGYGGGWTTEHQVPIDLRFRIEQSPSGGCLFAFVWHVPTH